MNKIIYTLCGVIAIALVFVLANMGAISDAGEPINVTAETIYKMNVQLDNLQHNVDVIASKMKKIDENYKD